MTLATTLEMTKFALNNSKNIYWIVGGLPKYGDKISLTRNKKRYNTMLHYWKKS